MDVFAGDYALELWDCLSIRQLQVVYESSLHKPGALEHIVWDPPQ